MKKIIYYLSMLLLLTLSPLGILARQVSIQYNCGESNTSTSQIRPKIKIINQASGSLDLTEVTVRYYYSLENPALQQFHCDYALIGSSLVQGNFVNTTANDYYLEISFSGGSIQPGSDSGEIQLRFNKVNWSMFDQADDYSFNPAASSYMPQPYITLYQNGTLIWGEEPDGNMAPVVSITAPADGSQFEEKTEIAIKASAEDFDGSIALVEFFVNDSKIAADSLSPYTTIFTPAAAGLYTLTARAVDNQGKAKLSAAIKITVTGNLPPSIKLTSPQPGAIIEKDTPVQVTADASDDQGIKRVEFYLNGQLAGKDVTAPYAIQLTGLALGNYTISATAFDLEGASTVSKPVQFSVQEKHIVPPEVVITAPLKNAYYKEGDSIRITADAVDRDGSVVIVEFYEGKNLLGTDSTVPYSYEWTPIEPNMYGISAVAYDNDGSSSQSRTVPITVAQNTQGKFNYGEALQKAIWFYEVQQSGTLPAWNRVNWRADSALKDGHDHGIDLTGGWFDAGDHIKFGLPMAASAHNLAWGVYEYKDAYIASGQYQPIMNNLRWVLDYFIKCHTAPNEFFFQVSDKPTDHKWWGPAEMLNQEVRKSYKATLSSPASCVVADTAAALALGALLFKDQDPQYAAKCLTHARQLFNFAWTTKSDEGYSAPGLDVTYKSWSGFWDELQWAAVWLHIAAGEQHYLDKAESCVAHLNKEDQSDLIKYTWGHCWDDKHYGAMLLLARLTNKQIYKDFIEMHLDWWAVDGANGWIENKFAWLCQWGSMRHAANTALLAFVYADWVNDPALKQRYQNFAQNQIDFALGDNSKKFSFMIGLGADYPQNPHHRTTNGSWWDSWKVPGYTRHVLYGALVGGPEAANINSYNDAVDDYESNEVACDYNSGLVGCLAKMYSLYGGDPLSNFPIAESPDMDEFFVEAASNNLSDSYNEVKLNVNNRSAFPARRYKKLAFKYFMDLKEVFEAGYAVSDITVSTPYVEFDVHISDITHHKGSIYFVKVSFVDGNQVHPGGQSPYAGEVQLRLAAPAGTKFWDPGNDYSFQGIGASAADMIKSDQIPVYNDETLLFGIEP